MALHIQMSEEAEAELRKTAMRNRISSMAASLLLLLIGGLILFFTALVIMQQQPSSFIAYTPPAEDLPPTMEPTVQEVSTKASPASTDVSPTIIVAHGATSPVQASINLDATDGLDLSPSLDISMGEGFGGLGDGLGDGGMGMGSSKGGGSALVGTFYDLKLTRSGASTGITYNPGSNTAGPQDKTVSIISDFMKKGWSAGALNKYYQSKTKLYASCFVLPSCNAQYAPTAYQCDKDKVKPGAWVAVYRGKVRAPKSGYYRFVGTGDDLIAVRFKHKLALEAGWAIPTTYDKAGGKAGTMGSANSEHGKQYHANLKAGKDSDHKGYVVAPYEGTPKWNTELGGLTHGEVFQVKEGEVCPIEILISEIPGGAFGFVLLIEEVDKNGKPINGKTCDIFRTNFSLPKKADLEKMVNEAKCGMGPMQMPVYNEDSPIWTAVP